MARQEGRESNWLKIFLPPPLFPRSTYDENTIFASSMDPEALGMVFVFAVPLPAGIYLFLSGLIGLGLIKKRK